MARKSKPLRSLLTPSKQSFKKQARRTEDQSRSWVFAGELVPSCLSIWPRGRWCQMAQEVKALQPEVGLKSRGPLGKFYTCTDPVSLSIKWD